MPADTVEGLRAEVETLRETLRQYQEALRPTVAVPTRWRMTNREQSFLVALYAAGLRGENVVGTNRMYLAVFGSDSERSPKDLDTHLWKVRRKLRLAGVPITITKLWSRGWRLDDASMRVLREAIEGGIDVEHTFGAAGVHGQADGRSRGRADGYLPCLSV